MHNEVVKSDIHSTDTGGYSEILFGAMHLLGFAFAPRIKNFAKCQLYAFQKRKGYEQQGYKILPDAYIKPELLADQWDEILRFIATIKLKEATASQLFKRLNSYSRQHPLYHALKEFGKIPKSDFLLRYTDILAVRQAVEKQLNKGESMNKLARAVSFGNNQEFLYGEKVEQQFPPIVPLTHTTASTERSLVGFAQPLHVNVDLSALRGAPRSRRPGAHGEIGA
jgi:TnpA family transposase